MMRIIFGQASQEIGETTARRPTGHVDTAPQSSLKVIVPGALSFASLICVVLFEAIFGPLLNPLLMPKGITGDMATPVILGVLVVIGGVILYATRTAWERFVQNKTAAENRQSA